MIVKYNLDSLLKSTNGECVNLKKLSSQTINFSGVGTDTRMNLSGQIFFALKGDVHDAHAFLEKSIQANAAALVVHQFSTTANATIFELCSEKNIPIVLVKDTLKALQDFSHIYRHYLSAQVIAITGSNGKTTTKEFCAQILSKKFKTHFSHGSFNNHWGVPLTILSAPLDTEVLILEMGMNHAKELTELIQIGNPDIVVCTSVGKAHIEHFGSIEKIADAKKEIYQNTKINSKTALKNLDKTFPSVRIFNLDNEWTYKMFSEYSEGDVIGFGTKPENFTKTKQSILFQLDQVSMQGLKISGQIKYISNRNKLTNNLVQTAAGKSSATTDFSDNHNSYITDSVSAAVSVFGSHNLINIMAAASVALATGMSVAEIQKNISLCHTNWGRNQLVQTHSGAQILFDGYNANPDSMKALISNLKLIKNSGQKIAVLAEMLEMGSAAEELHFELGEIAGRENFSKIYFFGKNHEKFASGVRKSNSKVELKTSLEFDPVIGQQIASTLNADDIVLVKGSRGMKTERFVFACDPVDFTNKV